MKEKEVINVYWSPGYEKNPQSPNDWSMLYPEPITLYDDLFKNRNSEAKTDSFFTCPATRSLFKKTLVFRSALHSEHEYDFTDGKQIINPISKTYYNLFPTRTQNLTTGPLLLLSMAYLMFADKPLLASFSSPTFNKTEYLKYGSPVPGEFDIGQWFRTYNLEFQMWEQSGKLKININDPLFYVKFNTDKEIILHRFNLNDKLWNYVDHCINDKFSFGFFRPLNERYKRFQAARLSDSILTEIKKNLVERHD